MADRFIVTSYAYRQRRTLAEAERAAAHLELKYPQKVFKIFRLKTHLQPGGRKDLLISIKEIMADWLKYAPDDADNAMMKIHDKIKEYEDEENAEKS